jgi:cytochrome c-type biogenesis protein CcmH/NrfG
MISSRCSSSSPQRFLLIAGAAVLGAVVFAAGYQLGGRKSATDELPVMPRLSGVTEMSPPAKDDAKSAGRLEDLLPSIEAKVAANPGDMDQRVLLARTYVELGQRDKGITALRALRKDAPQNTEVLILLATTLSGGGRPEELREALGVYDAAVQLKPAVAPMARLYQGEALEKLGDGKGAIKVWKEYLATMPTSDQRRALFEQHIAAASAN